MKDITSRKDIDFLMRTFYSKALLDSNIGVFFTDIAQINLDDHLPHIASFWEQQLFFTGGYKKNVLQIHQTLNTQKHLEQVHFETWLSLFNQTVDAHFLGEKANLIKTRALSIATVIQLKIKAQD